MGKTKATKAKAAKASAAAKKKREEENARKHTTALRNEDHKISMREKRWKEKLQHYRENLRRKRGEPLTKEEVRPMQQ